MNLPSSECTQWLVKWKKITSFERNDRMVYGITDITKRVANGWL